MAENSGNSFSWFLSGLGIGALIGVLYAPKSGQETRDELVANALGSKEYLKQRSREVSSQVGTYVDTGKAKATEYVETSKAKLDEAVEQGRFLINEQKEKVSAAIDAGKDAYVTTTGSGRSPILAADEPV
jgi:gas vesicle protein